MLTKAREVLFAKGFTFFIAGSPEIARHIESIGIIFDKTLFLEPADYAEFEEVLNCRLRFHNPKSSLRDIFQKEALNAIYETSRGIRKQFIRLAENALDMASGEEASKVKESHVAEAVGMGQDQINLSLSDSQTLIMKKVARLASCSPSDKTLQKETSLKRETLRQILEELFSQGYVTKEKKGRKSLYSVASPYKPYFQNHSPL